MGIREHSFKKERRRPNEISCAKEFVLQEDNRPVSYSLIVSQNAFFNFWLQEQLLYAWRFLDHFIVGTTVNKLS